MLMVSLPMRGVVGLWIWLCGLLPQIAKGGSNCSADNTDKSFSNKKYNSISDMFPLMLCGFWKVEMGKRTQENIKGEDLQKGGSVLVLLKVSMLLWEIHNITTNKSSGHSSMLLSALDLISHLQPHDYHDIIIIQLRHTSSMPSTYLDISKVQKSSRSNSTVPWSKCLGPKYDPSALGVTNLYKYFHELGNFTWLAGPVWLKNGWVISILLKRPKPSQGNTSCEDNAQRMHVYQ